MPSRFARAELWTDLPSNGGTFLWVLPFTKLSTTERVEKNLRSNRLLGELAASWEHAVDLIDGRVVLLVDSAGAVEEYRIVNVKDTMPILAIQVFGDGIIFDLAERDALITETDSPAVKLTWEPAPDAYGTLLTNLMAFAPSYFSIGTLVGGGSDTVAPTYDGDSVLAGAVEMLGQLEIDRDRIFELAARRSAVSPFPYLLDTLQGVTGATPDADIRTNKNLTSLARERARQRQVTRCYPRGQGGSGIGDAHWVITAVNANVSIDVADIDGLGPYPVVENGALDGKYWFGEDGVARQITSSTGGFGGTQRLFMNPTPASAVGKWGRIAANSAGDYMLALDYPSKQTTYGKIVRPLGVNFPAVTNWIKNGDLKDISGSDPAGWTTALNRFTRVTTPGLFVTGGASYYTGAAANTVSMLQGRSVYCPANAAVIYFWRVLFTRLTGVVTSDFIQIGNPNTGTKDQINFDATNISDTGIWLEFSRSYNVTTAGVKALATDFWRDGTVVGGGGLFYVDCSQVLILPRGVSAPGGFVRHSGAAKVYGAGITKLRLNGDPPAVYDVTLNDLTRADGTQWPYEALVLGSYVNLTESITGISATDLRIMEIVRDWLNPLATRVTLASNPFTLSGLQAVA